MPIITVDNVWKKYRLYHDKCSTLKEKLLFRNRNYYESKWVIQGISFCIERGKTVGIIGQNGSGKSTLLKLLTKIIYPNSGRITTKGKVASLLELGGGFHPDMTGLENIYINASIFGLSKREIDSNLDRIIEFSGLAKYMNNAVRTYSDGMYMRLAFSVAINVKSDILIIDEVLGVGDTSFQNKCYNKMLELQKSGLTIIVVSHDLYLIQNLCNRVIWLNDGHVVADGIPVEICNKYLESINV